MRRPPHGHDSAPRRVRPLALALVVILAFMGVEVVGGLLTGSLALLADAAHSFTDVAALGLALLAVWLARRPHTTSRTYGYSRAEVLAALANGVALWAVAGLIFWEASQRMGSPPEVKGAGVMVVAAAGLSANVLAGGLLIRESRRSIGARSALIHVSGDALGSVGVIVAGAFMAVFGWYLADSIASVVIAVVIVGASYRLVRDAVVVLLEAAPSHVDVAELCETLEEQPVVLRVHDIHIWTITPGYEAMSAHVVLRPDCTQTQSAHLLDDLRRLLAERFGISHMTVQVEGADEGCLEAHPPQRVGQGRGRA